MYSPDLHPYRLNFLLRGISGDESIEVASSASNELPHQASQSKAMILDITTWLRDGRLADLEVQRAAQEFIFTRGDLYTSDMLVLQYSVDRGQPKGELTYENVKEALLAVLMVENPDAFRESTPRATATSTGSREWWWTPGCRTR